MQAEIQIKFNEIEHALNILKKHFNWEDSLNRIKDFNKLVEMQNFWNDTIKAQSIMRDKKQLEKTIDQIKSVEIEKEDLFELMQLAEEEKDAVLIQETSLQIDDLVKKCNKLQLESLLSGEADSNNCYVEIHAGAGGTESQDWAEMLRRMYLKWFDKKKFTFEMINEHKGEEAGIKSSTLKVSGTNLYGLMKNESGVHRLVRISPFDSGARRHTSFASVWVYPVVDDSINVVINEKDLRIDTYRSSGAGGQHVNTTDSAVRITHLPTKIVVQCQNERSQHKNKETCFKMLKARLYEFEIQKREQENSKELSSKTDIGWGHQIRSYVLQPYQLVKDLRNKEENTNPDDVLNGNIDNFIEAGVKNKLL